MKHSFIALLLAAMFSCTAVPEPCGPVPTPAQLAWQQMEMNMFVHFGPNTFSGLEWGTGMEAEDLFRPTELDCRQWARTAKAAGMKGIILTAKHHDGFCLWPNPVSKHCVPDSLDVLRKLSEACAEEGLKFGVYISPWDRKSMCKPCGASMTAPMGPSLSSGSTGPAEKDRTDGARSTTGPFSTKR